MIGAKHKSDFEIIKDTPNLTHMGELRDVFSEDFGENGQRFNGTASYSTAQYASHEFQQCWNVYQTSSDNLTMNIPYLF